MRLIGNITDKSQANLFSHFLIAKGIDHKIDYEESHGWEIWVDSEDQLEESKKLLDEFLKNPQDTRYKAAVAVASHIQAQKQQEQESFKKRFFEKDKIFQDGIPFLTLILIVFSVGVTLVSMLGEKLSVINYLLIAPIEQSSEYGQWYRGLSAIREGQVWRLFTPIFIHYGIFHILFNMMWLKDLGGLIEKKQSAWYLGIMILVIAAFSNLAQFYVSGPLFGGMSGVVYGLFGYVWIRGRFDPSSGYYVHSQIVWMMVIWFFLCLFNVISHVANTAHGVGLAVGCIWGYISAVLKRDRFV